MFKVEAMIDDLNPNFFNAMQDNDYYLTDGGENFVVLEHTKNKSKIRIYVSKSGDFFANFRNSLDIGYLGKDIILGDIETVTLSRILETIHDKDFQDFCNDYKDVRIYEGTKPQITEINRNILLTDTQQKIKNLCDKISDVLIDKNKKYGNSAIQPIGIFYKGDNENSILIRLDDKLSRIINNNSEIRTNDIADIIGYLVLLLIAKGVTVSELEKLKD